MKNHVYLEFEKLKDEQISRIRFRDGLFYFTMLILGGALTLACSDKYGQTVDVLLAVPFAVFIAGVAHITCDRRIDDIGIYIRDVLAAAIAEQEGIEKEKVFAWERNFRGAALHGLRSSLQNIALMMLYVGSGVVALWIYRFYAVFKQSALANAEYEFAHLSNAAPGVRSAANDVLKATHIALFWDDVAWAIGAVLMLFMAVLIARFVWVKSKRPKATGAKMHAWISLLRWVVVIAGAAAVAAAVEFGKHYVRLDLVKLISVPAWLDAPTISVQTIDLTAAAAALIAGLLLLLFTRR
jgi:hypothetical protein